MTANVSEMLIRQIPVIFWHLLITATVLKIFVRTPVLGRLAVSKCLGIAFASVTTAWLVSTTAIYLTYPFVSQFGPKTPGVIVVVVTLMVVWWFVQALALEKFGGLSPIAVARYSSAKVVVIASLVPLAFATFVFFGISGYAAVK